MDNRCFKLKRSKCALVFQLFIFAVLMFLLYQLLPVIMWLVCGVIGLVIYQLFYRKIPHIEQFEYLDGREWSLTAAAQGTRRVLISHVIDHQAYIVVYFQHAKARPLLIWCDQLPFKQWKSLKVLTKIL
ncbi:MULTISPECIES: hypothetical protein [Acinetobacter]|uniref:hypothetical protein n=1 Tax=Acinetobacter TaxID=469 RepID=UPI001BB6C501|nr:MULTISPECIES: hypothetical protein [Acinetobacter]MCU4365059.1 hypothetical protein [Acinetobacter variabilis]MCU4374274.1 hypothetical protein [Acinetobacter variabilis]BCT88075.1 hypothetical protein RYU24_04800 [Acinetobacter variabilis]